MKQYLFLVAILISSSILAQPVLKKTTTKEISSSAQVPKLADKKTASSKGSLSIIKPSAGYKLNPDLAARMGIGMTPRTTIVNGKKITTRMVAVNSPQLVAVNRARSSGVTQKIKPGGSSSDNGQYCQTYNVKVSANSEDFDVPYGSAAANIYPGAAYLYEEYYKNTVSPASLTWEKNPIYIQVSSSSGNGKYELVEKPERTTLEAATGRLKATLPSTPTNESTSIKMLSLYDQADFSLKVNGGGGGFGFTASASFGLATQTKKSYFLIDAVQTFFTMNAILPEGSSGGFFKDVANNANSHAMFMSSVSYGRRVIGVLETEFKDEKMLGDFKAKYSNGVAGGYAELSMMNGMNAQSTKVKLYFVGGNATSIEVPNATEQSVRDAINNYMRTTTTQNAVPIKFTFRNMAMSGMRYESATDNFTYQQCVPIAPELKYNVKVNLMMIDNSKNEEVKFGLVEKVNFYAFDKLRLPDNWKDYNPFLAWGEFVEAFRIMYQGEEAPRSFTRSTNVNRAVSYQVSQSEMMAGAARIELITDYIAMYATKVFGKTNESYPKKTEKVYLRDVITSGGGSMNKEVQVNFNGRIFTLRFTISATPM